MIKALITTIAYFTLAFYIFLIGFTYDNWQFIVVWLLLITLLKVEFLRVIYKKSLLKT